MLRPPKAITLAANAAGSYSLLYVGDDVEKALAPFDNCPVDCHVLYFFRNGVLQKARETEVALTIRNARLEAAEKASKAAETKAKAAAIETAAAAKEAATKAAAKIRAESEKQTKAEAAARAKRNAEILQHAAKEAQALSDAQRNLKSESRSTP